MFNPSSREDAQLLFNATTARQMSERAAVDSRRRSAEDMATSVADEMVSGAAMAHPDVFAGRDLRSLRSLIAGWILRGE
jgi:hypothetical protein